MKRLLFVAICAAAMLAGLRQAVHAQAPSIVRTIAPQPVPNPRVVVATGSSICSGLGATTPAQGYIGQLASALTGFTVVNNAISGQATSSMIANFRTQVAAYNPGWVIICPTMYNETGGSTPTLAAFESYVTNVGQLVQLARGIGAVPIVVGQPPNGVTFNAGTVSTSTTAVTGSGTDFISNGSWNGLTMTINSVAYTISSCADTTHCTLTSSAGTQSGVSWSVVTNGFSAAGCQYVQDSYDIFERLGVYVVDSFDVLSAAGAGLTVSNGCSYQQALSYGDGIHPNQAGQNAIYSAIELGLFYTPAHNGGLQQGTSLAAYTAGTDTTTVPWLLGSFSGTSLAGMSSPQTVLSSWTSAAWVKNAGTGSVAIMHWGGSTGPLRIRNSKPQFELIDSSIDITSGTSGTDSAWHHLVVTYNYPANYMCFYVDGAAATGTNCGTPVQFQDFSWSVLGNASSASSNCQACSMTAPAMWAANLTAADVRAVYNGRVPMKSLIYYSDLATGPRAITYNRAPTDLFGTPFTGSNGVTQGGAFFTLP